MSDWGMYELEDILWDEFGGNDDHIVPHPGGTAVSDFVCVGDWHKRPWSEVINANGTITDGKTSVTKYILQGKEKSTFHSTLGDDRKAPMLEKGSWSHVHDNAFPASCDSYTSKETKTSNNCFKSGNVDSVGDDFSSDDPILGNGDMVVDNSLCHFQLDDISTAASDLEFFKNGHDRKESNDLLDYGWPDIGNFDDVDKMFRNCDSIFGQGDTVNDLSWISTSSHAIDQLDDTPKSGFRSSYSEGRVLKSTLESETDKKLMPAGDHLAITDFDNGKGSDTLKKGSWNSDASDLCAYSNWFDADTENKEDSASIDQENTQSKQSRSKEHLAGKRKIRSSEFSLQSSGPAQQLSDCRLSSLSSSSQVPSQQRQLWGDNSSRYLHAYIPYQHQEYGHPSHQFSVTRTGSSIKSERKNHPLNYKVSGRHASNNVPSMEKSSNHLAKFSTAITEEKDTFADQAPVQKKLHQIQDEVGGDSEVVETGIEFAPTEIDSSTVQESSCMSSVLSNEISLEATSFQQLQDVMGQLDIRTKLCIRDSLYRLARSAEQRHDFGKTNSSSRVRRGRSGTLAAGESNKYDPLHSMVFSSINIIIIVFFSESLPLKLGFCFHKYASFKCLGFMDPETDTNPIDRSIAQLLFYRPSGSSARPSNDALSLESEVIIHGSMTNLPVHDQLVCQEDIACDADVKAPITEQ
ncbi:protein LNK1 [Cinnamomum micranthum f. kanehirae]|uniref:Protein LNK1 n=1 Tax=Cinnamomum micranthum f. kanehirae TaxID=337451 RepID=A0A443NIW9_9MAGN|nr:protein LNK1 [Cinnamomum micranthum f. kanehirae]